MDKVLTVIGVADVIVIIISAVLFYLKVCNLYNMIPLLLAVLVLVLVSIGKSLVKTVHGIH